MLLRAHHAFDAQRLMAPGNNPEHGYASFLASQLDEDDVVVFVAERTDTKEVVGYVYAGLEPQSWKELRDAAGFVHDVAVAADARRTGVASALMQAAIAWLKKQGAPRVVLWSAAKNEGAQRLFEQLGFRRTMVEMTKEL
jgi:ribosomal protein S18 acetylase RimI-like enzyme